MTALGCVVTSLATLLAQPGVAASSPDSVAVEQVSATSVVMVKVVVGQTPDRPWTAADARIRGELLAAGFQVIELSLVLDRPLQDDESLAKQARKYGAVAVVRAQQTGDLGRIDVWLADGSQADNVGHFAFSRASPTSSVAVDDVALQTVEFLHASFIEVPESERQADALSIASKPTPPPPTANPEPPRFPLAVRAGAVVVGSPGGGAPALMGGTVGLTLFVFPRFGIDGDLYVASALRTIDEDPVSVHYGQGVGRLHAVWRPRADARVSPLLGVGVGGLLGKAPGADELAKLAVPSIRGGVNVELGRGWHLGLAIQAGYTLPDPIEFEIQGEVTAEAGRPLVDGGITLGWSRG